MSLKILFEQLRAAAKSDPVSPLRMRERRLAALALLLQENQDAIAEAVSEDFGHRAKQETKLLELFPSLQEVRHARRHVAAWMKPQRRGVSMLFQPGSAKVVFQPLGVVGIIVPWNYPIYLSIGPLVAGLAAGNRAMIKMSELTPVTGALLSRLVTKYFPGGEVHVVLGDAAVAQEFVQLGFDHLLFTGSTPIGREVMRGAAQTLTPVTLELGGKSPAIVGADYPLKTAVQRIVIGKCMNAGQTCVAPDYALVPEGTEHDFIDVAKTVVREIYPCIATTDDYTSIINNRHWQRLSGYLDDARAKGAEVIALSDAVGDAVSRRMPPVAVLKVSDEMRVMQEEIFGPVLPIMTYRSLNEAMAYVNAKPHPLAMYYFSRDRHAVDRVLRETVSGGVTINDTILHIAQENLPFGGVGPSGMGRYHGREGFETFSHQRSVFHQARINGMRFFKPPYGAVFDGLIKFLIR